MDYTNMLALLKNIGLRILGKKKSKIKRKGYKRVGEGRKFK